MVWEGHCLKVLDGAVYKDEMRKMREDGRITNVSLRSNASRFTRFGIWVLVTVPRYGLKANGGWPISRW